MRLFAFVAFLTKPSHVGFDYHLKLGAIEAFDREDASARYGAKAKEDFPDHVLQDVVALEIQDPTAGDAKR
jgi:hypothetical protein